MEDKRFDYHQCLQKVADRDVKITIPKDKTYGASWQKRGGVGAFMMLARKWDRIEEMLSHPKGTSKYDIFEAVQDNPSGEDGTVLAEVRDLRRYLLLVEAEMMWRIPDAIKE